MLSEWQPLNVITNVTTKRQAQYVHQAAISDIWRKNNYLLTNNSFSKSYSKLYILNCEYFHEEVRVVEEVVRVASILSRVFTFAKNSMITLFEV